MTSVLDASSILAFLQDERGADAVESALEHGAAVSVVNAAEVAQKIMSRGRNWPAVRALLESYDITFEPATLDDAEWTAQRWRPGEGLSIADRFCLALSARLDAPALTADRVWGDGDGVTQIR